MKKIFFALFICLSTFNIYSIPKYTLFEYCTGTWCPTCPCAHRVIKDSILVQFPNTIVVSYHGQPTSTDPYRNFNGNNILALMSFSSYASATVNRTGAPQTRAFWMPTVGSNYNDTASVEIIINKNYDIPSRQLTANIQLRALGNLSGNYYVNYVFAEDSIITVLQNGNGQCPGSSNYRLDHVVRDMINGATGELVTNTAWNYNQVINKTVNYSVSNTYNPYNSYLIVFVYKDNGGSMNVNTIQQAGKVRVSNIPVGIIKNSEVAETYSLQQNYPNPFNPSTNIKFSITEKSYTELSIYNALGERVDNIVSEVLNTGSYEVTWNSGNYPSGVYYYTLKSGSFTKSQKMILIK